ncbi:MAG: ATP-binding cassette domain-containing protein [Magnetococcales bacterium]|nr:ATP-binding cassette domain-containing protein [Magnetococcales bacterium]MBF0156095.1 ATP-binding cassette domain-containing protein [Magnetococcales bacterium]
MRELWQRFRRSPGAAGRLLLAALLINFLALSSSLYTIQVLNRFVSHGVTGTLVTLTVGVMIALVGEYLFRALRHDLARGMVGEADRRLATGLFGVFLTARLESLDGHPPAERQGVMRGVEQAAAALGAVGLTALSDLPFSLMFLAAVAVISWPLGVVTGLFLLATLMLAWRDRHAGESEEEALRRQGAVLAGLLGATEQVETIRQFGGGAWLLGQWEKAWEGQKQWRDATLAAQQGRGARLQFLQTAMVVTNYAVGAMLVVAGQLDVGLLIGANIMAGRALTAPVRLVQLGAGLRRADRNLRRARRWVGEVAVESEGGTRLPVVRGELSLREVGFRWPESPLPLLEGISAQLQPGGILLVAGSNGSGKSSLLRLLCGLRQPTSGQILVDGVDLRQLSLPWWRGQLSYLPQEPTFFEGSIRDNLAAACPGAEEALLRHCLERAGLARWLDGQPQGWHRRLAPGGGDLAPGLRRRLALARALVVDGPLVILDEPTEGLDPEGCEAFYGVMVELARAGRTLVVASHDANIRRGAGQILELGGAGGRLARGAPGGELRGDA